MNSIVRPDDFDRLHLVQAQLATAQKDEVEALRALTAFTMSGGDRETFDTLTQAASQARAETDRLLAEWKSLVRALSRGAQPEEG
jgi:BMFP domain-containing protein YqiC